MNEATLLFRQVNPSWIQHGRVTSQVFKPTPKDNKMLSVYDGDLISPDNAWIHYTTKLGFASVGVYAVTVQECTDLDLNAKADPQPFPEHAVIDFKNFSANQIDKKAKQLKAYAESRGWLFERETE